MNATDKKPRKSKKQMAAELQPPNLVPVVKTVEVPLPPPPPPPRAKKGQAAAAPAAELVEPPPAVVEELRAEGVAVVFVPDERPSGQDFAAQVEHAVTDEPPPPPSPEETLAFRQRAVRHLEACLNAKLLQRDYARMKLRREQQLYDRYRVEAEELERCVNRMKARMRQGQ